MNKVEKRIKIAEVCGWTVTPTKESGKRARLTKPGVFGVVTVWQDWTIENEDLLPDYFTDLNPCREMRAHLSTGDERVTYSQRLRDVMGMGDMTTRFHYADATAEQHAEAFGLTLGLWT